MTAETPETPAQSQPIPRLAFWPNVGASFKHIRESVRAEGAKIRKYDPITVWLVPLTILALVFATQLGTWARVGVGAIAFFTSFTYILHRIGIVRSMNHRQTNLVWHLLLATFILGMLFAFGYLELVRLIWPAQEF